MAQFRIKPLYLGPRLYPVHCILHCIAATAGRSGGKSVSRIRIPFLHGWLCEGVGQTLYPVSCICILHFVDGVGVGPALHPVFCICILYQEQRTEWGKLRILYPVSVSRICSVGPHSVFCILHLNPVSGLYSALGGQFAPVSRIRIPYPAFGTNSVSRIPYPYPVSTVSTVWLLFGSVCAPCILGKNLA